MIIDIVLVYATGRGGLEDVISNVSNELVKRNYRVRVFQSYPPQHIEWESTLPEIYYYGEKGCLNSETLATLAQGYANQLKEFGKPDIILATHAPGLSFICRSAISMVEGRIPPVLSWLHGPPEYFGNEDLLRYSDGHLAISSQIGHSIKKAVFPNIPIYLIGNPVKINNVKRINRSANKLHLIYIGRIDQHQKRLDILFKSLSELEKEWKLTCIGDGPDTNNLKQLAYKLGIEESIEWLGWKDDPWDCISEATALVLTSDYEGFGLVLVESLSRGLPVIAPNIGGPIDIIINGKNGWLFPVRDSKSLTNILKNIQDNKVQLPNPEDCEESVKKFEISNVINNIELILNYHIQLEDTNTQSDILNKQATNDKLYQNTDIAGQILSTVINGIEYIGTSSNRLEKKILNKYFTEHYLKQIEENIQNENSNIVTYVCYPKITKINYKFSKSYVEFLLFKEIYKDETIFNEKVKCEVKLVNINGSWKIDDLILHNKVNNTINKNTKNNQKKKILLVTTNNSGSNTFALYKNIPEKLKNKLNVEIDIIKQNNSQDYFNKVTNADVLITTEANILFEKELYNPNQVIIDLWHGFPLKAMGYLDKNEFNKNILSEIWKNIDIVCSYSELFNNYMRRCFNVDKSVFSITGAPRNDLLLNNDIDNQFKLIEKLFNIQLYPETKILFYMPTYRKVNFNNRTDSNLNRNNIFGFSEFNEVEFEEYLCKNNLVLIAKLHPIEEHFFLDKIKKNKCIHLLTDNMLSRNNIDLYELLGSSTLLITDYSSVFFDYLLLNKPIIFMPLDKEEYERKRGFLVDSYDYWTPGPKVLTQKELQNVILEFNNNNSLYLKERIEIKNKVHTYQDYYSSQRVWNLVGKLLELDY